MTTLQANANLLIHNTRDSKSHKKAPIIIERKGRRNPACNLMFIDISQ